MIVHAMLYISANIGEEGAPGALKGAPGALKLLKGVKNSL